MRCFVPFRAEHLSQLQPTAEQRDEWEGITPEQARTSEVSGDGYSLLVDEQPVACAVLIIGADGRGALWAFIGGNAGPHLLTLCRFVRHWLDHTPCRRIEALVLTGFSNGCRWMDMLNFELETPNGMRSFGPNGESYLLYARTK
jgi:hypothetical protein